MAGRITLWGAEQLLKTSFGRSIVPIDAYYLALVRNTAPSPYISGSELEEPTETYSRVVIPNTTAFWNDPGQKQTVVLADDISIDVLGEWGTLRYWALCNAATGGYLYVVGSLENSIETTTGDTIILTEGDLTITLGPFYSGDF